LKDKILTSISFLNFEFRSLFLRADFEFALTTMWWYETRGEFTQRQFGKSKKSAKEATLEYVKAGIGLGRRDDQITFGFIHW